MKPFKNGARCRECGRRSRLVRRRAVARWRLPVREVTLGYPRARSCAAPTVEPRRRSPGPRVTRGSAIASVRLAAPVLMTQKAAAQLLQMPASICPTSCTAALNAIVVAICGDFGSSASTRSPTASVTRLTLVYDWSVRLVVWVVARGPRATMTSSSITSSAATRSQIHTGCCDMSEAYMGRSRLIAPMRKSGPRPVPCCQGARDAIASSKGTMARSQRRAQKGPQRTALAAVPAIHSLTP